MLHCCFSVSHLNLDLYKYSSDIRNHLEKKKSHIQVECLQMSDTAFKF